MECACIGSGSDGNAVLVRAGGTTVLVDCGLSGAVLARGLARLGMGSQEISAVLVSHEHSDHVAGLAPFVRRFRIPVYTTKGTAKALVANRAGDMAGIRPFLNVLRAGEPLWVGALEVLPFRLSHDAAEPVGFRLQTSTGLRAGLITDTGEPTAEAEEALMGCHLLGIESNHSLEMLRSGPYPAFLKRRILSARGHLSNGTAAALLGKVADQSLRSVLALHLSKVNNTPELAREALGVRLLKLGSAARVHAPGAEPCAWHTVDASGCGPAHLA